jgi:hypothetical protein
MSQWSSGDACEIAQRDLALGQGQSIANDLAVLEPHRCPGSQCQIKTLHESNYANRSVCMSESERSRFLAQRYPMV